MEGGADGKRPREQQDANGGGAGNGERRKRRSAWDTPVDGAGAAPSAVASAAAAAPVDVGRISALQLEVSKLHHQLTTTRDAAGIPAEQREAAVSALLGVLTRKQGELAAAQATASTALAPSAVPASAPAKLAAALASLNAKVLAMPGGGGSLSGPLGGGGGVAAGVGPGGVNLATRVYIGSLHYEIGEPELRAMFSPFGRITKVDVSFEPATGRTKGYAFISYETVESADRAILGMNGQVIAGRPIKVGKPQAVGGGGGAPPPPQPQQPMMQMQQQAYGGGGGSGADLSAAAEAAAAAARAMLSAGSGGAGAAGAASGKPSFRVYVGAVPYEINAEHLKAIFGPFGAIRTVTLLPSTEPGSVGHRGYGFIEFEEEGAAKSAIESMNGFEIGGRRLKVNQATSAHAPGGGGGGMGAGGGAMGMMGGGPAPSGGMLSALGLGGAGGMGWGGAQQQQQHAAPMMSGAAWGDIAAAAASTVMGLPPAPAAPPLPFDGDGHASAAAAAPPPLPPSSGESRVTVALSNMVVASELAGDPDLEADISSECGKFGRVLRVNLVNHSDPSGRVTIFVEFADTQGAQAAVAGLDRRYFGGRVTSAALFP